MEYICNDICDITDEMVNRFIIRTDNHIELVNKYLTKISVIMPEYVNGLQERGRVHDASKYASPELFPYVLITWKYWCKDNNIKIKISNELEEEMNKATEHHCLLNDHHPEYFCGRTENLINKDDRDGSTTPSGIIDATKMPDICIAEMVGDWMAVSEERGSTPTEWAEKVINKKWRFTDNQIDFVYDILNNIWS